ncbi:unnamed protein product [Rotaria sp. Silwood1]|nr:unnamed protein product [Rotaria sp. Silwood1]
MRTDFVQPVFCPDTPQPDSHLHSSTARASLTTDTGLPYVKDTVLKSSKYAPVPKHEAFVYIPDIPADVADTKLEQMINERLNSNHHIKVAKIKCHSSIGVGIVFVSKSTDKHALLNIVRSTILDPETNIIISFVEQLELISYLVFDQKKQEAETVVEVARRWAQLSQSSQSPTCEQISVLFPNIFKIISRSLEELLTVRTVDVFKVNGQFANVYLRADCSFVEDLPQNITAVEITKAINAHMNDQYDQQTLYVQYNKEASSAVVLAVNAARKWMNIDYISLNNQICTKKTRLAFRVVIHPVSRSVPINLIIQHRQFQNTVTKHTQTGEKLIIELNDRSVYDQCLIVGALRVTNYSMHIDPYTVILNDPENSEINADNWYEMQMLDVKKPDIMQFVVTPQHPIFKYKWNAKYWLQQFECVKGVRDQQSDRKRHLLRVTTMLNTLGVIHKKSYTVETGGNKKEIKLKFEPLKTIAYNHRSKLAFGQVTEPSLKPPFSFTTVEVVNSDCLLVYETLAAAGNRPVLLNMANATTPGGGYRQGAGAQEENLFRRSNYCLSLDAELDDSKQAERYWCTANGEEKMLAANQSMYPIEEFGAIYTSGITMFRNTEDTGYAYLEKPVYDVCAIAVAAYQQPELKRNDKSLLTGKNAMGTRKKIENLFAITHCRHHDCLVLSALGCGAFRNPPTHVAVIFKSVIQQYAGYFKTIHFAIVDDHNAGNQHNPDGNYLPFRRILDGLRVDATTRELGVGIASGPFRIVGKDRGKMIIDEVYIFGFSPCQYGAECHELGDTQHCQSYSHPPMCPQHGTCDQVLKDEMHRSLFIHRTRCQRGGECALTKDEKHIRQYDHPDLNKHVNFVRNQYKMIKTVRAYVEAEKWKESKIAIPQKLIEWIRALQPIHRCSKVIFESILVHGHVMSRDYMNLLREAQFVANAVEQHNQVRQIFDHHNNQALQNHGRDFIRALVAIEFDKVVPKRSALFPVVHGVVTPHMANVVHHSPTHDQQIYIVNVKETQLKLFLKADEIATIRAHATEITQASLRLHSNPMGIGHGPDETLGTNRHVFSILGPHLGHYYGDVFIVFKRELIYHPDTNFSIQAATTFGASTNAYKMRPWLKDPGSDKARIQQFNWNKLHCSVSGYEEAAAIELMALTGQKKKTMNVDLNEIQQRWLNIDSHQVFEMHLPQLIPLDYIDHIYMPTTVFYSLTPSAQQLAKGIFRGHLTITSHKVDLNALNQLDPTRVPYQAYVIDEIMKKFADSSFYSPQGTLITLPASKFEQQVAIPMTISQSYRQYQEQHGQSDTIFIYWKALGGDMMLTVSNEFIDLAVEQRGLQCLTCYIANISLNHSDVTGHESYSYISNYRPYHHDMIMQDRQRMKAMSNSFHRGCNTDDYITYCLIIKFKTREVILAHAGSNSIYNHQTIACIFQQSELNLDTLDYIHISGGARIVPVRNLVIRHQPIPEYHPSFDKEFKQDSKAVPSKSKHDPAVAPNSMPDNEQSPAKSLWNQVKGKIFGSEPPSRKPCSNSINCLLQYSDSKEHNEKYSHPCRFSELCRSIPDHPHLEHISHLVPICQYNKICRERGNPIHRAQHRHSDLPDYLVPCRYQQGCSDKTDKHRIKYSHGEKVPLPSSIGTRKNALDLIRMKDSLFSILSNVISTKTS